VNRWGGLDTGALYQRRKVEGALTLEYVYRMIDNALIASGNATTAAATNPAAPTQAQATSLACGKPGN